MITPARPGGRESADHLPGIDRIRALAIGLVIAYHLKVPLFAGGLYGVDVFFVISGFLISRLLLRELYSQGAIDWANFFMRRARRLLPAAMLVLATTLVVGFVVLPPTGAQAGLAKSVIAATFYVSNLYFWKVQSEDYYAPGADELPLLHTWSLGVEEQFYALMPVAVWLWWAWSRRRVGNPRLPAIPVLLASAASLGLFAWASADHSGAVFYLMPLRAWEFGIGWLLALAPAGTNETARPSVRRAAAIAGFSLVSCAAIGITTKSGPQPIELLLTAGGSALLISATLLGAGRREPEGLVAASLAYLGRVSYSLYLWHWPVLSLGRGLRFNGVDVPGDAALALLSLGLACVTYHFVEKPFRFGRFGGFRTPRAALASTLVVSALVTGGACAGGLWSRYYGAETDQWREAAAAIRDRGEEYWNRYPVITATALSPKCPGPECDLRTIVVWGDSHARALLPMLDSYSTRHPLRVVSAELDGCPPLPGLAAPPWLRRADACMAWNKTVLETLLHSDHPEAVSVAMTARWAQQVNPEMLTEASRFRLMSFGFGQAGRNEQARPQASAAFAESLRQTVSELTARGIKVLLLADVPEMKYNAPMCLHFKPPEHCALPRTLDRIYQAPARSILAETAGLSPLARLEDLSEILCDASSCSAERGGRPAYFDADHLTASASRSLAQPAGTALDWLTAAN